MCVPAQTLTGCLCVGRRTARRRTSGGFELDGFVELVYVLFYGHQCLHLNTNPAAARSQQWRELI
jgi:hypothetical protein